MSHYISIDTVRDIGVESMRVYFGEGYDLCPYQLWTLYIINYDIHINNMFSEIYEIM